MDDQPLFRLNNLKDKDTITVHCIVERIADALGALVLRQSTAEISQNEETMELDNSLNRTSNNAQPSTLLSDLLQSYSKGDSGRDKEECRDEFDSKDECKNEKKECDQSYSNEFNKDELSKSEDNRDDRPNYSPRHSNQMESDQQECAIKDSSSPTKYSLNKNPLSIVAEMLRSKGQTNNYKIEDDFYVELPANTPLQELVRCALTKQGYSVQDCSAAKGFIELRNWKPLTLDQISDDSETTILDILGDIAQIATLRVQLSTTRSKSNTDFKDKLLQFLLNQCYGALSNPTLSSNPESINSFNSKLFDLINESNNNTVKSSFKELDNNDEKSEPWYLQQLLSTIGQPAAAQQNAINQGGRRSVNSNSSSSSLVNSCNNSTTVTSNLELDSKSQKNNNNKNNSNSPTTGFSSFSNHNSPNQLQSFNGNGSNHVSNSQNSLINSNNFVNSANNHNSNATNHFNQQSATSFPNRTRIRTSFDPEHELPKLHRWFQENQHPTRPQIQEYVRILNNLESRRGRKPLDVNNVLYWFKNNRAQLRRNSSLGGRNQTEERRGITDRSSRIGLNGQNIPQFNGQNPTSLQQSMLANSGSNDQLCANELMLAQFNQHQQNQLLSQLQRLNHQNTGIADLLSSGAGKNALKSLMLKNAGLIDEDGLMNEEEDEQQMNEFGQQSKDSDEEDNQNEETDQTFSNFARTLDLSVKQQQQQSGSTGGNLKRRKIDTSSTFDECDEQFEKDSTGSASPMNQKFNRTSNNLSNNGNKQHFALSKQLNTLKQHNSQNNQENRDSKEDNQLVNSDGELDEENQESEGELDDKEYYTSMFVASMHNSNLNNIGRLAQNLAGNNNLAANFLNPNYLQQTMNDLLMNRLISSQSGNAAAALANNSILSSAAGLIASSAAGLNAANVSNSHPLSALANPTSASAFGNNNLLLNTNPHSPDDGIRRIRRSRTFIDPITEVPRLEKWFSQHTHPSHSQIVCYTDELNNLPYRQKFPKLEPKNIQFWFKNFRAKSKRVGISSNQTSSAGGQTNSSSTSITSQSNSQSDSPTPPNDSMLCMNGNSNGREFVGRLVH